MTKKQTFEDIEIGIGGDIRLYINDIEYEHYTSEELLNLLNKLSDENEQFKKQKKYLKRKIQRERTSAIKEHEKWEKEVIELIREQRKFIDDLNKENEQLKQILNELSNRLQFDVENGIRSYPVKLSEYLCNALKELQE